MQKLELLNSEGPILVAHYVEPHFIILDQYKIPVAVYNRYDLKAFTEGIVSITNSKGKVYDYSQMPADMKPSKKDLIAFLALPENTSLSPN